MNRKAMKFMVYMMICAILLTTLFAGISFLF